MIKTIICALLTLALSIEIVILFAIMWTVSDIVIK